MSEIFLLKSQTFAINSIKFPPLEHDSRHQNVNKKRNRTPIYTLDNYYNQCKFHYVDISTNNHIITIDGNTTKLAIFSPYATGKCSCNYVR
jgi:hypothetical protein